MPDNPRAWLVSTGRFKAIDRLRRQARFTPLLQEQAEALEAVEWSDEDVEDDRLRLIFTCCHPALAADAQVPLTLREICDLTTEEIARAFLATPATIAQRIVGQGQDPRSEDPIRCHRWRNCPNVWTAFYV